MPLTIIRQDITKLEVDAIVNAANTELQMGGGVCGAIFKAAGPQKLQAACQALAPIQTGEAVMTPGFDLPASFIIHAAGPVYDKNNVRESERLLRSAYTRAMELALENKLERIAFPLISSGIYGYPKEEALRAARSAITDFLEDQELDVILTVYDKSAFTISRTLLGQVEDYLDQHYTDRQRGRRKLLQVEETAMRKIELGAPLFPLKSAARETAIPDSSPPGLEAWIGNLDESFSRTLLRLIDVKGKTDTEVYKRANIDRKLFSKIRSNDDYRPSKRTAIAFAVALELSPEESRDLLRRAGFALSPSVLFDVIVDFFISRGRYNIFEINEVLFTYDQPLLGG